MFAIIKKELWFYFGSFLAYLIISFYVIFNGLFLFIFENQYNIFEIGTTSMNPFFNVSSWLLMVLVPALTMRTISEEENQGTLQWIFSRPVYISSFILAKFISVLIIIIVCLICSFTIIYTLYQLSIPKGNLDLGSIFCGYLGLLLISSVFISVGIFASSLNKNQIISFLMGIFICFLLFFGLEQIATYKILGSFDFIVQNLSLYYSFSSFAKGVISVKELSYFIFLTLLFITLSVFIIKRKI